MINPYSRSTDNLLFRKNYHLINKPQQPPLPSQPASSLSASKVQFASLRNPFLGPTPTFQTNNTYQSTNTYQTTTFTPFTPMNQSRALSMNSRVGSSLGTKNNLGRSRLIDQHDGWKRDLQNQERKRLQMYGAQGLRYNSYGGFKGYEYSKTFQTKTTDTNKINKLSHDYYGLDDDYSQPIKVKPPVIKNQIGRHDSFRDQRDKRGLGDSRDRAMMGSYENDYKTRQQGYRPKLKQSKQAFIDQTDQDQVQKKVSKRNKVRFVNQQQIHVPQMRKQTQQDMFAGSNYVPEHVDKAMRHNSYVNIDEDDMVNSNPRNFMLDSKPRPFAMVQSKPSPYMHQSKHYQEDEFLYKKRPSIQYDMGEQRRGGGGSHPDTVSLQGQIYYRIQV